MKRDKYILNGVKYGTAKELAAAAYRLSRNQNKYKLAKGSPIECEWNGIKYKSITEASIAGNVPYSTMYYRVKCNHVCDEDLRSYKKQLLTQKERKQ